MKIGMVSLGCPKNLVDSEVMLGLAQQRAIELTRDAAEADVLVVNTCAFIDKAKQESIDTILEMAEHKKTGACRGWSSPAAWPSGIATSCARRFRRSTRCSARAKCRRSSTRLQRSRVAVSGPALRSDCCARTASRIGTRPTDGTRRPRDLPTYLYDADTPRLLATPRHYAYVKIAEGCDYKCAFCIIPTLRGKYRSRSIDSIVARGASGSRRAGVKELLLISQDTSFYGIDRGERGALARLLRALNRVDGLEWIRMLYLYPTTIGDDVLDAMAESEKVCRYVDLPLQHASDAVLKRMKRPGTRASYEQLLDRIRDACARRHAAHDVHRRLPRRDRRGLRRARSRS